MKAFFDIDTQIDFLFPAGSLYVPGAERLLRSQVLFVRLLLRWRRSLNTANGFSFPH